MARGPARGDDVLDGDGGMALRAAADERVYAEPFDAIVLRSVCCSATTPMKRYSGEPPARGQGAIFFPCSIF